MLVKNVFGVQICRIYFYLYINLMLEYVIILSVFTYTKLPSQKNATEKLFVCGLQMLCLYCKIVSVSCRYFYLLCMHVGTIIPTTNNDL